MSTERLKSSVSVIAKPPFAMCGSETPGLPLPHLRLAYCASKFTLSFSITSGLFLT
jgi:hypothetical protein